MNKSTVTPTAELNQMQPPHETAQQLVDSWQPLLQGCDTKESLNEMLVFCVASIFRDDKSLLESLPEGDAMFFAQKVGKGIAVKMAGMPSDLCEIFSSAMKNPDFMHIYKMAFLIHMAKSV